MSGPAQAGVTVEGDGRAPTGGCVLYPPSHMEPEVMSGMEIALVQLGVMPACLGPNGARTGDVPCRCPCSEEADQRVSSLACLEGSWNGGRKK